MRCPTCGHAEFTVNRDWMEVPRETHTTQCYCDDEMDFARRLTASVSRVLHHQGHVVDGDFEWDRPSEGSSEAVVLDDDVLCMDCWETGEATVESEDAEIIEGSAEVTMTCEGCGAELSV